MVWRVWPVTARVTTGSSLAATAAASGEIMTERGQVTIIMMTRSGSVQSVSTAGISEMTSASGQSGANNSGGEMMIMMMMMLMIMTR